MSGLLASLQGAVAQGVLWGIMVLGVYITYRLMDIADLTVDGSFALGACVCAVLVVNKRVDPVVALLVSAMAGLAAGAVTQQDSAIGNAMGHIENSNRGWNYMGEAQRRPVRRSLERRNPSAVVSKVRRAAAFGAHHAGADGVFGRTCVAEQRAVVRRDGAA